MKKKIIISVAAVLIVAIGVILKVYWSDIVNLLPKTPTETTNSEVVLIAHRGFSSVAPANTLAAVKEAGNASFYGAEFDIRLTSDGEWVVIHNDSVKSMTDSEGLVSEMVLDEVTKLRIDNGYGLDTYPDEKIPTLAQALEVCNEYNIIPVIEIKLNDDQIPDYSYLAQIIKDSSCEKVTVISFNADALLLLKEELPEAEYWLLKTVITEEDIKFCTTNRMAGIDFNAYKTENYEYIEDMLDVGLKVGAWTVDSTRKMEKLYDMGVTYITTNTIYP